MAPLKKALLEVGTYVLKATDPGKQLPDDPAQRAVLGLLQSCRRRMKALLILGANDADDAGDGLVRMMFDHAATAGWLAADLSRFETFKAAYDTDWAQARSHWEKENPGAAFLYANDAPLVARAPGTKPVELPKLYERARDAGLDESRFMYKTLAMSDHPTLASEGLRRIIDVW